MKQLKIEARLNKKSKPILIITTSEICILHQNKTKCGLLLEENFTNRIMASGETKTEGSGSQLAKR